MDEVYQMRLVLENHAALTVEAPARIVWVKRVGHCYDVGADFLPLDGHALTQLKWIIEQVEKSAGRDALGKIRVELLPPQARPQ
jgi:hypothetical protein